MTEPAIEAPNGIRLVKSRRSDFEWNLDIATVQGSAKLTPARLFVSWPGNSRIGTDIALLVSRDDALSCHPRALFRDRESNTGGELEARVSGVIVGDELRVLTARTRLASKMISEADLESGGPVRLAFSAANALTDVTIEIIRGGDQLEQFPIELVQP